MTYKLITFCSDFAFYCELIVDGVPVQKRSFFFKKARPVAYPLFDEVIDSGDEAVESFEFNFVSDLPGYFVISVFRRTAKGRVCVRSYLFGRNGFIGEFPNLTAALQYASRLADSTFDAFEAIAAEGSELDETPLANRG